MALWYILAMSPSLLHRLSFTVSLSQIVHGFPTSVRNQVPKTILDSRRQVLQRSHELQHEKEELPWKECRKPTS